jgi:hypothetical protein
VLTRLRADAARPHPALDPTTRPAI